MIRKLKRVYKQGLLIFLLLLCLRTMVNISRMRFEPRIHVVPTPPVRVLLPSELMKELNETAHDYPRVVSTVELVGPGIDPRTEMLRNLTIRELSTLFAFTCDLRESFMDRFVSDKEQSLVKRYKYMQEASLVRTVVEVSLPPPLLVNKSHANAITLLTQLTSDRTYMLDIIQKRWEGPIVAVVYAMDIINKHKQLSNWLTNVGRDNIKILLVKKQGVLYPVNWLRNLALSRADSKYIFVTDGDFVPSLRLYRVLLKHLNDLEKAGRTNTVLIVPAFEMLISTMKTPGTRDELLRDYKLGLVDYFHRAAWPAAHNVTDFTKWKTATKPYVLPRQKPCNDIFEPYVVMSKQKSPYFPETLLERRKNKIAYQYELCMSGFEYMVIHDGFLIHKHHPESMRASAKVEKCVEIAWEVFKTFLHARHPKDYYKVEVV